MTKQKIGEILQNMTMEDKISLLTGSGAFEAVRLPEDEWNGLKMSDGPNGVKTQSGDAICFMNTCLMACSWDSEICHAMGEMLGSECIRCGVDILLAPAMNIKRTPFSGRNFEYYSEDPYLTGTLASAFVAGIGETGVNVCAKHFACNNQESNRFVQDCLVDEDTMRNIYLRAFEILFSNVEVDAVMASYNKINGVYACENEHLLKDVLRDEWGYNGVVMSDWCAVNNVVSALKSGLDLEMPGNLHNSKEKVQVAVSTGQITETEIDKKVQRLLRMHAKAKEKKEYVSVDINKLVQMTGESFVLLKNDGILPFSRQDKLLLVGNAKNPRIQGGGCAELKTNYLLNPYDEISRYASVCDNVDGYDISDWKDRLAAYDKIVVFLSLRDDCDSEAYDKKNIDFPIGQTQVIAEIALYNPNIVAVLANGSVIDVTFENQVRGVLETYYSGSYGARALAKALYGEITPSGKLAESFPMRLSDAPVCTLPQTEINVTYGEREFIGYRYYTSAGIKTRYPFGFGLSYCEFVIDNVQIMETGEYTFTVQFDVENKSDTFDGKEVVQIYLKSNNRFQPRMQLIAYQVAKLKRGEKAHYQIELDRSDFSRYVGGKKRVYEGEYGICVATSSEHVVYEQTVMLCERLKKKLDKNTLLGRVLSDDKCRPLVLKKMQAVINVWAYGEAETQKDFETERFLKESVYNMPFRAFTYFDAKQFDDKKMNELIQELNQIIT